MRPSEGRQRRASIGALAVTPTMLLSLSPNGASLSRSPARRTTAAGTLSSPVLSDWCTLSASECFSSWTLSVCTRGKRKGRSLGIAYTYFRIKFSATTSCRLSAVHCARGGVRDELPWNALQGNNFSRSRNRVARCARFAPPPLG